MEYKRFKDKIVIRIDRGEEIIEQIAVISEKESIRLASSHCPERSSSSARR